MTLPPELAALRDEAISTSCISWALQKRWALAKVGVDKAGPCPMCGGVDRFSIHTGKNTWNCRRCDRGDAGVISLVMWSEGVDFVPACEIITGRKASEPIDPKVAAANAQRAADEERKRLTEAEKYRQEARIEGWNIICSALPFGQRPNVLAYLRHRGIDPDAIARHVPLESVKLWEHPDLPWMEGRKALHRGVAMLGVLRRPDELVGASADPFDHFGAVHRTWLDLAQLKGKLVLPPDGKGKPRPAKKMRGSVGGCAIRLYTPKSPSRMVMGEGIETTLTALAYNFEADTAYWAAGSLGNMAGRAGRDGAGKVVHHVPDMGDTECFVPPEWVRELIFICDSDDAETRTEEKLVRGIRRAMALRPGIEGNIVPPIGDGKDLNDLVMP